MISVEEARARLLAAAPKLPAESVALADAAGRVLAEPVVALRTQPPFSASAMDGYALRAADLPGPFLVVGEAAAGRGYPHALGAREAVRIFTGAPLPQGADTVLIQEDAIVQVGRPGELQSAEASAPEEIAARPSSVGTRDASAVTDRRPTPQANEAGPPLEASTGTSASATVEPDGEPWQPEASTPSAAVAGAAAVTSRDGSAR